MTPTKEQVDAHFKKIRAWELECASNWDRAKELAAEGWEPFAVTTWGDTYDREDWYYFRRKALEDPRAEREKIEKLLGDGND